MSGPFTVDDVFRGPQLLSGRSPTEVAGLLGQPEGWRVERLSRGSRAGSGWVLREYNAEGVPTGRMIQWHPGGGHHGADPYWKVSSPAGGVVRVGPQFGRGAGP
ncbi:hypothetical protein [Tautonia plasticadhaerens]|uniref:Uncharacterized protein n=1 Tax=Tautonia plasticadhaerens TaxID=2527974 RepID=A0A518HC22_9BACT|nr:hypothetical protein [Tautonia plasticadhaerens]QDV38389.1 hypothetical protein ElP_63440 [Tautonia plasticadhaerens]